MWRDARLERPLHSNQTQLRNAAGASGELVSFEQIVLSTSHWIKNSLQVKKTWGSERRGRQGA